MTLDDPCSASISGPGPVVAAVSAAPFRPRDAAGRHLAGVDADLRGAIGRIGRCGLGPDRSRSPYEALVRAIAHQQVHGRAAAAILGRFVAAVPGEAFPSAATVRAMPDACFRDAGFSANKARAIRDIARGALDGTVPSRAGAARLTDAALIERLTTLHGVGRWTVEMLLIFTLGRPDVLPVDDWGVRDGHRRLRGREAPPTPKALALEGAAWSPHRSTAAWYLWRLADEGKPGGAAPAGGVTGG